MRHLPISENTIREGMRTLAKEGKPIANAYHGQIVKRRFTIRDEILNRKLEEDEAIDLMRDELT